VERRLWRALRSRRFGDYKFRRQQVIGPFIVDFVCPERSLVVEADGGQHACDAASDRRRTEFLRARGYRVLRFWNNDVLTNLEGVLQRIAEGLKEEHWK
jgi:very-short-patch-repair endonuclease